ncbi:MAG TPA: DUF1289 domain-containing protein [Gallionellaceae bacterium]|nr:DUF1289 domain-containing protein [Gallionellaceae bacterium]
MQKEGGSMMEAPGGNEPPAGVQSPCVRNCCLDDDEVCLGCGRSLEEILRWNEAGDDERRTILDNSRERRKAKQARFPSPV